MDSLATKNVESMICENDLLAQTMALLAKEVDLVLDWENIGYYVLAKNNDLLPKTATHW
jgi:hypothetical protein